MINTIKYFALSILLVAALSACSSSDSSTNTGVETGAPLITSLAAAKTEILYGGEDPAVITCTATGGNLTYTWEVDLGDIIPLNGDHSKVQFTGAACCVGAKTIKCTVSNSLGSVSQNIVITILEQAGAPEVIAVNADRTLIHTDSAGYANIVCYATGGSLKYKWTATCGDIAFPSAADSSKIKFTPSASCIGADLVKCVVSNAKGAAADSVSINVSN